MKRKREMNDKLRTLAVISIIMVGATLAPSVAATDAEGAAAIEEEPGPDDNATGLKANRLVVDGATGEVVEWHDHPEGDVTSVRVTNVAPNETGAFTLIDPWGRAVFANQTSTQQGVVEFWYVLLRHGVYTVQHHSTGEGVANVTAFSTKDLEEDPSGPGLKGLLSLLFAASNDCYRTRHTQQDHYYNPSAWCVENGGGASSGPRHDCVGCERDDGRRGGGGGGGKCSGYSNTERIAEAIRWTPLLINHAPHGGKSTATATWSKGKGVYVAPMGWESAQSTTFKVSTEDGKTSGTFALAKWGIYRKTTYGCGDTYTHESAKVIDWRPKGYLHVKVFDLWGQRRTSDSDDITRFFRDGYESIRFSHRYQTTDARIQTPDRGTTAGPSSSTLFSIHAALSIGNHYLQFDAFQGRAAEGSEVYYVYEFPKGGDWYVDYLGGSRSGWAFCRNDFTWC